MKRKFLDFSVMKEEISQNNVLEMAELKLKRGKMMKSKKNALIATLLSVASVSCVISAFVVNAASKANKTIQLSGCFKAICKNALR